MKLPFRPQGWRARERGFTMVEIALSIAVVAFAMVAILGVLPTGLQVQKDNREETIVNADGAYLLEALRTGNDHLGLLSNLVYLVSVNFKNGNRDVVVNDYPPGDPRLMTGQQLVGLLGTPRSTTDAGVSNVVAWMRALNGSAIEKDPDARDVAFRYQVVIETQPYLGYPPDLTNVLATNELARLSRLQSRLHEVRLTMQWPLIRDNTASPQNARVGTRRRTFRALVGGIRVTNEADMPDGDKKPVFYLRPSVF